MSWYTYLLGPELLTKDGLKPVEEVLKGKKRLGMYFSAHWCPPCRRFTPALVEHYKTTKEADADDLEIVFVSCDRSQSEFDEYFSEMTWTAIPFASKTVSSQLQSRYQVSGIPRLIIFEAATGFVLDENCRSVGPAAAGCIIL